MELFVDRSLAQLIGSFVKNEKERFFAEYDFLLEIQVQNIFQLAINQAAQVLLGCVHKLERPTESVAWSIGETIFLHEMSNLRFAIDAWMEDFSSNDFVIESVDSDRHEGRHSLLFQSDTKGDWVYKPRSASPELWLERMFRNLKLDLLHCPEVIEKDDYHWSKYVSADSRVESQKIYRTYGILWVIWSVLGGCDLHPGNLILNQQGIWIVDAETFASPFHDLKDSLKVSGLLIPDYPWAVNLSAFAEHPGIHLPSCPPGDEKSREVFLEGVRDGIALIRLKRDLINESIQGVDFPIRVLCRDTEVYQIALRHIGSLHSQFALGEISRRLRLSFASKQVLVEPFVKHEVASLLQGDVPIFFYQGDMIVTSDGTRVMDANSLEAQVSNRVKSLDFDHFDSWVGQSLTPALLLQGWWLLYTPFMRVFSKLHGVQWVR
jgi:hypothetical protein